MSYKISDNGLNHIMMFEQSRLKAYDDGKGNWTIGYGHTGKVNGVPVHKGMVITKEQERQLLQEDITKFEKIVKNRLKVPVSQNQFDALVSFAFNLGNANAIIDLINKGEIQKAGEVMLQYNKATNQRTGKREFMQGLANRRESEVKLFFNDSDVKPTFSVPTNIDGEIDAPINPLQNFSQATPLDQIMQSHEEPINDHQKQQQALAQSFYQLNDTFGTPEQAPTLTAFEPPEPPDYSEKLASAFGIAPSTQGKIPDYIGDMIKSIYDQTA